MSMFIDPQRRELARRIDDAVRAAPDGEKAQVLRRMSEEFGSPPPASVSDEALMDMWEGLGGMSGMMQMIDHVLTEHASHGDCKPNIEVVAGNAFPLGYVLDPVQGQQIAVLDDASVALAISQMPEVVEHINSIPPVTKWAPEQIMTAKPEDLVKSYVQATGKSAWRILGMKVEGVGEGFQ